MIRAVAAFLFLATASASAWAQSSVLQGGPWAPGRAPMYVGQGSGQAIIQDSGPAGGGAPGVGLSELGLTARGTGTPPYAGQGSGPFGTNFCDFDAPTTNLTGYHFLCLSANAQGGGLLTYGAGGGAAQLAFKIKINGQDVTLNALATTTGQMKAAVAATLTNGLAGFYDWVPADIGNTYNIAYNGSIDATSLNNALLAYMETALNATPPGLGLSPTAAAIQLGQLYVVAAGEPR